MPRGSGVVSGQTRGMERTDGDGGIVYPAELPITGRLDELRSLLSDDGPQVIVVAGETGSGKSTQLPKLCLELGRGREGKLIGHTQPRRIAARTIAQRVADELGCPMGQRPGALVGYAVRFTDEVGPDARIKQMTDGILLAELQRDRDLRRYDTIIIDEAHERSLNIDFLLGYLRGLLPRRPDLKVIITSATIDTDRFARHFAPSPDIPGSDDNNRHAAGAIPASAALASASDDVGAAPVMIVEGRTHPVEVRYRPLDELDSPTGRRQITMPEAVAETVRQLHRERQLDCLVFCPGEREIRETVEAIRDLGIEGIDVLPLHGRLSAGEQAAVFSPGGNARVIVSTNVAETSVTVPRIMSVIDTGTARISRYSHRTKVQRLPIEPISQASANQRAGRCGRLGPGVCVRLYAEDDFDARPEFTDPEIQRTNLASVVLQMAALGLGPAEDFPFVDPPDRRAIRNGVQVLHELDAIDDPDPDGAEVGTRGWLTGIGRDLVRLPVDPRFGRMLLDGAHNGALAEVLRVVAFLSLQDVRERPADQQEAAAQSHARFRDDRSDIRTVLNLWDYTSGLRDELGSGAFRRRLRQEFLHANRTREWFDLERQLRRVTKELRLSVNTEPASDDQIHESLLGGLIGQIGMLDQASADAAAKPSTKKQRSRGQRPMVEYRGAHQSKFAVQRGSALSGSKQTWIAAAELIETNRMWARMCFPIRLEWVERLADHLVTRSYEPVEWDAERGSAMTVERVSLYGLPLVAGRRIQLGSINPEMARRWFIERALVDGAWEATHPFIAANEATIARVESLGARSRERGLAVEPAVLEAWFDERVPASVSTTGQFGRWWRKKRKTEPERFHLPIEVVLARDPADVSMDFPDTWPDTGDPGFAITYRFDITSPIDGLTVEIPSDRLLGLDPGTFSWHVPGHRAELVEELIRTLPKPLRRQCVPIPETAREAMADIAGSAPEHDGSPERLDVVLIAWLARRLGERLDLGAIDVEAVPTHLRPTFKIVDPDGTMVAAGKDLRALQRRVIADARSELAGSRHPLERDDLRSWDVGDLPTEIERQQGGLTVAGYPALVPATSSDDRVWVRIAEDRATQAAWHRAGVRRLLRFETSAPIRALDRAVDATGRGNDVALAIASSSYGLSKAEWYRDAVEATIDRIVMDAGGAPFTEARYRALVRFARQRIDDEIIETGRLLTEVVLTVHRIEPLLADAGRRADEVSVRDAAAHLGRLVFPGVLTTIGGDRMKDHARWLRGLELRLVEMAEQPDRDVRRLAEIATVDAEARRLAASPRHAELRLAAEELRVQTFAQTIGTRPGVKVSVARLQRAVAGTR